MKEIKERYEFDPAKAYRLVAVTDKEGNDKSTHKSFYKDRIGCVATNFRYDDFPVTENLYRLNMNFIRNQNGMFANRGLRTSVIFGVNETEKGFELVTAHSIYTFEGAEINEIPISDERNVIELFLSNEDYYQFAKGFYHDEQGEVYELISNIHLGTFQDSVLVRFVPNEKINGYVCRYFPEANGINFYNTIYGQQGYSTPIRVHNVGESPFLVRFDRYSYTWTINPGENKLIVPYTQDGADPREEE